MHPVSSRGGDKIQWTHYTRNDSLCSNLSSPSTVLNSTRLCPTLPLLCSNYYLYYSTLIGFALLCLTLRYSTLVYSTLPRNMPTGHSHLWGTFPNSDFPLWNFLWSCITWNGYGLKKDARMDPSAVVRTYGSSDLHISGLIRTYCKGMQRHAKAAWSNYNFSLLDMDPGYGS